MQKFASTSKFGTLHCCNVLCLQHGGGNNCRQSDVTVTAWLSSMSGEIRGSWNHPHCNWIQLRHATACWLTNIRAYAVSQLKLFRKHKKVKKKICAETVRAVARKLILWADEG